jgi:hypothetical protein
MAPLSARWRRARRVRMAAQQAHALQEAKQPCYNRFMEGHPELDEARADVAENGKLIERQRELLARLKDMHGSTELAERVMRDLEAAFAKRVERLKALEAVKPRR